MANLITAARAMIDAFGGDCPKWLQVEYDAVLKAMEAKPTVWIVSLEWNFPPSEVTGDTGIVGVFSAEAPARAAQLAEQKKFAEDEGERVYHYPNLNDNEDDWFIDVHCTEHEVEARYDAEGARG